MIRNELTIPSLDKIEQRLGSIESTLQQIHKQKAKHPFGLLTSIETAKALQITTRHLQNLRDRGDIGYIQYGRVIRYKSQDIQAYIDEYYISPGNNKGGVS